MTINERFQNKVAIKTGSADGIGKGVACRLGKEGTINQNISQISFDSGFENLSNFYKPFRRITGIIPKKYRKRFMEAQ